MKTVLRFVEGGGGYTADEFCTVLYESDWSLLGSGEASVDDVACLITSNFCLALDGLAPKVVLELTTTRRKV